MKKIFFFVVFFSSLFACEKVDFDRMTKIQINSVKTEVVGEVVVTGTIIDRGSEVIDSYGICWAETKSPTKSDFFVSLGTEPVRGEFTVRIPNLKASTLYYFRAFVHTSDSVSYTEAEKNIKTLSE